MARARNSFFLPFSFFFLKNPFRSHLLSLGRKTTTHSHSLSLFLFFRPSSSG